MPNNIFKKRFAAARRSIIERDFASLNDMQRRAVLTTEGPLLLLAGAGSGKTTVLINRIANIIKYGRGSDSDYVPDSATEDDLRFLENYPDAPTEAEKFRCLSLCSVEPAAPWQVMAITFTNKAAGELKSRLENMLGPESLDIWAMTFHSACVRILRRNIEKLGYSSSFTIYDTADSRTLMKQILKEMNVDEKNLPHKTVLGYISRAKDAMQTPEDFSVEAEKSFDPRRKMTAMAYTEYSRRMKEANALDFDDIILLTVRLLLEHRDVREYYQQKFRYVLIDEYQDTNNLQYLLASTLAGGHRNICVVGDDDQSIYKFRGATIENILSFESQYSDARVIRLEQNYRSTGNILKASNAVIKNNQERKGKELWTNKDGGDKLRLHTAQNEQDEASFVAGEIIAAVSAGANWRDFAILYRMNAQSNQLEYAFKRSGIPYRVIGGTRFFDRAEIKDILAYMCIVNNPEDDLRLLRIINTPTRGIGQRTVEISRDLAARLGLSLFEFLKRCREYPELQRSAPKLLQFTNLIDDLRDAAENMPLDRFYDTLLDMTGYVAALEATGTVENATRIENIRELKTNIVSFMEQAQEPTLSAFLEEIALYTDLDQYDTDSNCVNMMTMHSAKGLEFPTVFIVGAEDGIFPSSRSIGEPEEMEEERRLCYVAMTRAKQKLYMTSARQRMLFGKTSSCIASRFLNEIPADCTEKTGITSYPKFSGFDDEHHGYGDSGSEIDRGYGRRGGSDYGSGSGRTARSRDYGRKTSPYKDFSQAAKPPVQKSASVFATGDRVRHRAFGEGSVISVSPMGGDALLEVNFDSAGKKRLMCNSASAFMEKI